MTLFAVILSGAKRSRRTPPHVERLRLVRRKEFHGVPPLGFAPLGMTTL
jgi:hypothetical protein